MTTLEIETRGFLVANGVWERKESLKVKVKERTNYRKTILDMWPKGMQASKGWSSFIFFGHESSHSNFSKNLLRDLLAASKNVVPLLLSMPLALSIMLSFKALARKLLPTMDERSANISLSTPIGGGGLMMPISP